MFLKKFVLILIPLILLSITVVPLLAATSGTPFFLDNETYQAYLKRSSGQEKTKLVVMQNGSQKGSIDFPGLKYDLSIAKDFFGPGSDGLVLVSESAGSGGYVSWYLVRHEGKRLSVAFSRSDIFMGRVAVFEGMIEEWSSSQRCSYGWKQGKIAKVQNRELPRGENDRVLLFAIDSTGVIGIDGVDSGPIGLEEGSGAEVTIKVGQKLTLVRAGYGLSDRILYDGGEGAAIESTDEHNSWIGQKPGNSEITIVPDGYDWTRALHISVIVVQ